MSELPSDQINPYAPPTVETPVATSSSPAEEIRRKHIQHEASVKSIGTLYILGAVFLVPIGVIASIGSVMSLLTRDAGPQIIWLLLIGLAYAGLGLFQGWTGWALRKLQPWSRTVAIVFSAIGLIGFPIGTLIAGYFLYLLLCNKGRYVFSEEYREIIIATPHIKYRTSILVWILLVLLVLVFAGASSYLFFKQ